MKLMDLEVYRLAREIARDAWKIYEKLSWQEKKVIGDQFVTAMDSVSANMAEGYGRYHYLDKNKFNYNARGSLLEGIDWTEKLFERKRMTKETYDMLYMKLGNLHHKLNNYISATKRQKQKEDGK